MSALNNQTNRNQTRYFFATSEDGEQTLDLVYGTTGGSPSLSTMAVAISGSQGNAVVVNIAPQLVASEFVAGEQAVIAGTGGSYFTLSTLATTLPGVSISTERIPGTGTACIESYGTNGSLQGFEFLNRGIGGALVSTTSVGINDYMSSIGRPGAAAVLGPSGTLLTGNIQASVIASVDQPAGGGGRGCFNINDLSGTGGVQSLGRWSIGTSGIASGSNVGSDFTLYRYADAGTFLGSDLFVRRSDGAMKVQNMSSIFTEISTSTYAQVYPTNQTNIEFGPPGNSTIIGGGVANQPLYASVFAPIFSTPLTNLNPNGKTFLSINFVNSLSSGSNHIDYKVGFSTSTAYTNVRTTQYIPGGFFAPGGAPSISTPVGHTLITCCLDPDGVNPDGTGTLYVQGQLTDPNAPLDLLYVDKGPITEPTRYALSWNPM